jgi:uncharacterized membrane protein (DUF485 family)
MDSDTPHPTGLAGTPSLNVWDRIARTDGFRDLMAAKARFIIPATLFFLVYYFALPVLVGYAPDLMQRTVIGPLNIAYVFALSQFFMAWIVAALYMRAASRFDSMAERLLSRLREDEVHEELNKEGR